MTSIIKRVVFVVLFLTTFISYSQTITTSIGTITSCPDTITIPIDVTNFNNVASISLTLQFPEVSMNYIGYTNVNPELSNGTMFINGIADEIKVSWFSLSSVNIGTGKLLDLKFEYLSDSPVLSWDTVTGGNCQYSDPSLNDIPATFIDGKVISNLIKPGILFPHSHSINIPLTSSLQWSDSHCSPYYRLQISIDSLFNNIIVEETGLTDTTYPIINLLPKTVYWWRVNASIQQQISDCSDIAKFTTKGSDGIFEQNKNNSNLKLTISPNPVNDIAKVNFYLPETGEVSLTFYDLSGRISKQYSKKLSYDTGSHTLSKNLSDLPNGIYFCELQLFSKKQIYLQRQKVLITN